MKNKIKYFLPCLIALGSFTLNAQQVKKNIDPAKTIDSLFATLKTATEDTVKIKTLNMLSRQYIKTSNYVQALKYGEEAEQLSEKINNKKRMAISYYIIGMIYNDQGNYEKALSKHLKALEIMEEIGDKGGVANSYNSMGIIYDAQLNYPKALELYLKALKIYEKLGDKTGIANAYNNIGIIYDSQKNESKALEQYLKALKIYETTGDKEGVATTYNNIGYSYMKQNEYEKSLNNYLKAAKISEKLGDREAMALNYNNIGDAYTKQGKFEAAYHYLIQSLILSKEIGSKDDIKEAYVSLSELYEKKGDYKKAYEYHKFYSDIKDSLLNQQSGKQITEMNSKYESEKKDRDIELLTKTQELQQDEVNKQKLIRNVFVGGLMLALMLAFILYNRYNIKQKLSAALSLKNSELLQKNKLIEKQNEKIIDSITYAQRIQQSILMEENEIQNYLPDSFIFYQPKDIVSGDFYWCSKINDKIIIAAIDCTGHGVPGAFMSMVGNTLLNQIVNEKHVTVPSEILRLLNIEIYQTLHQEKDGTLSRDGMDVALCCIDYENNNLQFAGAQNPLYILSDNEVSIIKGDKQGIGGGGSIAKIFNPLKTEYTNHIIPIKKEMSIYLFSDGYMDQFGGKDRKKFGVQKFKEIVVNNQNSSMSMQKEIFANALADWKGNKPQTDDILVMGVRL